MSDNYTFDWNNFDDAELSSVNEIKAESSKKFDLPEVPDGSYQVEIVEISPQLENKLTPGKDRRGITMVIVNSEDPNDIGLKFRQYMNVSSHPKSQMYPYFKAAAGGDLDPDRRPKLTDLAHAQIKGNLVHVTGDDGVERQVFTGLMPVKKRYELPPF